MNIKINDKETTLPEELLKQIKEAMEKEEEWPKIGDVYYYLTIRNNIGRLEYVGDEFDSDTRTTGNFYQTKEEAEAKLNELKAIQRVKDYIKKEFGVFEPDWDDTNTEKAGIYFDAVQKRLEYYLNVYVKEYSPIGYLRSSEHAEQLIKDCKDDLLTIYK